MYTIIPTEKKSRKNEATFAGSNRIFLPERKASSNLGKEMECNIGN